VRQTRDESRADRIRLDNEHDGDRVRCLFGGRGAAERDEDIDLEADELAGKFGEALQPPVCVSRLDDDVFAVDVSQRAKPVKEGGELIPEAPGIRRER
jgi:hypothetical protein